MVEREIDVETKDGNMPTFVVRPDQGGPFPVVLYYMDAPGIREELRDMARRMADAGYYVVLPNLYYRGGVPWREVDRTKDEDLKRMRGLMESLTRAVIVDDTDALLAFAASDPFADETRVGAVGFCMSGPFVVAAANFFPNQVKAAASVHGAWFVTDAPDSSHKNIDQVQGELYFAWADEDSTAPREDLVAMDAALKGAGTRYHIDFFDGAKHGFSFPAREVYDRPAAEKHWEQVFALFERNLS